MAKLIAEIGINHLGDENKLISMIDILASSKIDSCKLQYRGENNFFDESLEMGSTLISQELETVNLSLTQTTRAIQHANKKGIEIGVSFFRLKDAVQLTAQILPDYFKVPSAEALNFELIKFLQSLERPVYVSTGGMNYTQLKNLSKNINFHPEDCVLYCVANYPVALGVAKPSYIHEYRELFDCKIGYSSHDEDWEMSVAFLDRKVDLIERHFTESKDDVGLDISTSSDLEELKKLQYFCRSSTWLDEESIQDKVANQGEIQNIKDLGSGYYFTSNYELGEEIYIKQLEIRSPCRGISAGSVAGIIKLKSPALVGEALNTSHLDGDLTISPHLNVDIDRLGLSLPVRLHDYKKINQTFNLENYEWHLSYAETGLAYDVIFKTLLDDIQNKKFSIHLPDYISSSELIDPISSNPEILQKSKSILKDVVGLAKALQDYTGYEVPIVGSFSVVAKTKSHFYNNLNTVINEQYEESGVKICPQFLPKKAWYFGGSVEIIPFCDINDLSYFEKLPFGICLDVAHCIMAANYYKQSHERWIKKLLPIAHHIHISDASGVDGEGVPFGYGELGNSLELVLNSDARKVVEQWEGHLNNFQGFKQSINFLISQQ